MNSPITQDTLYSQIPNHILDNYPNFYEFLNAYYEWLNMDGNPYQRIKHHLSYLDFQKSLDDYVTFMQKEYLNNVPNDVLLNKELFIKWSKRFNLSRGSRASYRFLFNVMYNEDNIEFYLPKENILRTSDGEWISNEYKMIVTNTTGSIDKFNFAQITQKREITKDYFEYAYATVQSIKNRYSGRYNVLELTISDIQGTFFKDYPITTQFGASEWIIDTVNTVNITSAGSGYKNGSRVVFNTLSDYVVERYTTTQNIFDTHITSFFNENDISLYINDIQQSQNYTFDGSVVHCNAIKDGDKVTVNLPSFDGYMIVGNVDNTGAVTNVEILETPIGISKDYGVSVSSNVGSGFIGKTVQGLTNPIQGYYTNNKGQLSSTMYLQDSDYYQEYSYALRTGQSLENYGSIVKQVLHPAGFKLFGYLRIIDVIEILIGLKDEQYTIQNKILYIHPKYTLGPNYSFFDRFKANLSTFSYKLDSFNDKPTADNIYRYSLESAVGTEYSDNSYNLVSENSLDSNGDPSWMTKNDLSDEFLYMPQDYTNETESGFNYFVTGFVSERS